MVCRSFNVAGMPYGELVYEFVSEAHFLTETLGDYW